MFPVRYVENSVCDYMFCFSCRSCGSVWTEWRQQGVGDQTSESQWFCDTHCRIHKTSLHLHWCPDNQLNCSTETPIQSKRPGVGARFCLLLFFYYKFVKVSKVDKLLDHLKIVYKLYIMTWLWLNLFLIYFYNLYLLLIYLRVYLFIIYNYS